MDETAHTGFRDRRIQPLCHLSGGASDKLEAPRGALVGVSADDREEGPQQIGAVLGEQPGSHLRGGG